MSKRHNIYRTRTSSFISSTGKIEIVQDFKMELSSSCFIANDSHVKITWVHAVVFQEHDILHF